MAVNNMFSPLPSALLTYNTNTLASITLPAGYTAYTTETASATQPEVGMGAMVISGKRRSFAEYERSQNVDKIAAMQATIDAQQAQLAPHKMIQQMHGSGTTNPSKLFWQAMDIIEERVKGPVHMTYRAVGSSTGQKEFLGASNGNVALNDFGSGDIPMTNARYTAVTGAGRTMVHVPFALGAIGVFHSVPASELPTSGSIHLTGCVLAKIFSGLITSWGDAEITGLAENAGMTATGAIKVVHRVKGSSSTAGFTEYLQGKCPASWSLGSGSTIAWPSTTFEAQGSGGMSSYISSNAYAIGYIDAGHGHAANLGEIALQNRDGVYLTTTQADIGAAGTAGLAANVIPADPSSDFSSVNLCAARGPNRRRARHARSVLRCA
jgi:ABC-type phosphate transport system substrate-binding protein